MPGEQSSETNSQPSVEDRVLSLFDPKADNEEEEEPDAVDTEVEGAASQEQTDTETEGADPKPEGEAVDVEFEGKSYKVAPELKDALLRQSDYTKKTQEAAEVRRTADTLLQHAKAVEELQRGQYKQLGQLASIDEQIAQYEKVDWNQLTAQNAGDAQRMFIAFQQLKDQRGKLVQDLNGAHERMRQEGQKAHAIRLEEGQKALSRDIKGWNADLGKKLADFGQKAYGFSAEEAASVIDPRTVKLLNDAYQWHQLQASKPGLEKRAPAQTKTLKPKASESRTPSQQETDTLRRAVRNAKTPTERNKHLEQLVLRKL